jgi:cytoskeletal protein CcmA (bactofilin family)
VEIKKDGSVIGDLTTAQIMIEDGADFKGSIEIDRGTPEEANKNVSPRAAAAAGAGAKII